jgi:hypothetical protein
VSALEENSQHSCDFGSTGGEPMAGDKGGTKSLGSDCEPHLLEKRVSTGLADGSCSGSFRTRGLNLGSPVQFEC